MTFSGRNISVVNAYFLAKPNISLSMMVSDVMMDAVVDGADEGGTDEREDAVDEGGADECRDAVDEARNAAADDV
jgi:hypothetical protein